MFRTLKPFFACLLSALILTTSGAMASARGPTMMVGHLVICTGTGHRVIAVDADYQPVGPGQYCPECALALIDPGPLPAALVLPPVLMSSGALIPDRIRPQLQRHDIAVQARGPPRRA